MFLLIIIVIIMIVIIIIIIIIIIIKNNTVKSFNVSIKSSSGITFHASNRVFIDILQDKKIQAT